ncbi:DUF2085 domain-containing protein [[Clostridium] colinum]|uniref:DUF2085 domain-containing protein n=1 Tax=[Clostridium] colinum TaxID=36835 RepID=UPI002025A3E1|nr:DUF2085 domain-containing protein [[Clostridium] colinum]
MVNKIWLILMEFFSFSCHQLPERSFFIKGYQMPVCTRCVGVFISSILAIIVFFKKKISFMLSILMSLVMLIDWSLQFFNIKSSTNTRRLITGLIGGFGYTMINLKFFKWLLNKSKVN